MNFLKAAILLPAFTGLLAASGVPTADMGTATLGLEYQGFLAGQLLAASEEHSELRTFNFLLRYAPVPYVLLTAGGGGAQFSRRQNDMLLAISPSISAAGGIDLFTPTFLHLLSVTAGSGMILFSSTVERDARYTPALLINPSAGLLLQVGKAGSVEAGVKGHLLRNIGAEAIDSLSAENPVRGYLALNLHAPGKAGYLLIAADASPQVTATDWSNGPEEVSFSLQLGLLLKQPGSKKKNAKGEHPDEYFGDYDRMSGELDTLAKELKKGKRYGR